MSQFKKRLWRKKHKEHLADIVFMMSVKDEYRKKLMYQPGIRLVITQDTLARSEPVWSSIQRWNLQYEAAVAPDREITDFPYFEGCILFKVTALLFPDIYAYSGNNPDVFL